MNVNSLNAVKAYGTAQQALKTTTRQQPTETTERPNEGLRQAADAVKSVGDAVAQSEKAASDFMVGKADPHSVVEALASAEVAVETAVTLRNRVVEAYQELIRMPV